MDFNIFAQIDGELYNYFHEEITLGGGNDKAERKGREFDRLKAQGKLEAIEKRDKIRKDDKEWVDEEVRKDRQAARIKKMKRNIRGRELHREAVAESIFRQKKELTVRRARGLQRKKGIDIALKTSKRHLGKGTLGAHLGKSGVKFTRKEYKGVLIGKNEQKGVPQIVKSNTDRKRGLTAKDFRKAVPRIT